MTSSHCQPVKLIAAGRELFLLRLDGAEARDRYATVPLAGDPVLATAASPRTALQLAAKLELRVLKQKALVVDLDAMQDALDRLDRSGRLLPREATAVVDGWHFLDDINHTNGCGPATPAPHGELRALYDKIFYASTFPARTYGLARPLPVLDHSQFAQLRLMLLKAWLQASAAGQIQPPVGHAHPDIARVVEPDLLEIAA